MNILFVNNSTVSPSSSGIQRITHVLVQNFSGHGLTCYGAYYDETNSSPKTQFADHLHLEANASDIPILEAFIEKHRIKFVIVQECWPLKRLFYLKQAVRDKKECLLVYCFHSMPGKELFPPSTQAEFYRLLHDKNKLFSFKKTLISLLPGSLYRLLARKRMMQDYQSLYDLSDKIILLSDSFIPLFSKYLTTNPVSGGKMSAIGNSLSFETSLSPECVALKQKEVLIVARFADRVKRISTALKIWSKIEAIPDLHDWKLTILGTGPDEKYYQALVKKSDLRRVHFEGRQDPFPYYKRASLYMLTSVHEGFGLVLTESQQMGVVPIAFDCSPAIHDIIRNDNEGYVIPDHDMNSYVQHLTLLMRDNEKREQMALNGLKSCERFSGTKITRKWFDFFGWHLPEKSR